MRPVKFDNPQKYFSNYSLSLSLPLSLRLLRVEVREGEGSEIFEGLIARESVMIISATARPPSIVFRASIKENDIINSINEKDKTKERR